MAAPGRERPAEPGTGGTTLQALADDKLEAVNRANQEKHARGSRAGLAAFLRARGQVTPQDAGLPAMERRRTPGLRR